MSVPSGHPRFAFLASVSYLLVHSFFVSTHRDEVTESATARAEIKNVKQHLLNLMSADALARFISRSRRNEDPIVSVELIDEYSKRI